MEKMNEWKGRINVGYIGYIFVPSLPKYTVNFIDKEHKERFWVSFPFYWLAKIYSRYKSWRYEVPIYDYALKSKKALISWKQNNETLIEDVRNGTYIMGKK